MLVWRIASDRDDVISVKRLALDVSTARVSVPNTSDTGRTLTIAGSTVNTWDRGLVFASSLGRFIPEKAALDTIRIWNCRPGRSSLQFDKLTDMELLL
jgi:hypothetical protein